MIFTTKSLFLSAIALIAILAVCVAIEVGLSSFVFDRKSVKYAVVDIGRLVLELENDRVKRGGQPGGLSAEAIIDAHMERIEKAAFFAARRVTRYLL